MEAILIFFLITWLVFGFVCYKMAEARGRNKITGFIMGFLFGILAVIGYAIIGNSEQKKVDIMAKAIKKAKE